MNMPLLDLIKKALDTDEEYDDQKIDTQVLNEILEVLHWTTSAGNMQPWEIYIIENPEIKKLIDTCLLDPMLRKESNIKKVCMAPLAMVVAIDRKRARARFGEIGEKFYAVQDTAIAVNNIRLIAAEKGISSSWIREIDLEKVADVLKLPKMIKPAALITLGYSSKNKTIPPHLEVENFVHWV